MAPSLPVSSFLTGNWIQLPRDQETWTWSAGGPLVYYTDMVPVGTPVCFSFPAIHTHRAGKPGDWPPACPARGGWQDWHPSRPASILQEQQATYPSGNLSSQHQWEAVVPFYIPKNKNKKICDDKNRLFLLLLSSTLNHLRFLASLSEPHRSWQAPPLSRN